MIAKHLEAKIAMAKKKHQKKSARWQALQEDEKLKASI
jgi:hypothetical protein